MTRLRLNCLTPYCLLAPTFLILLPFLYWPTLQSFIMSLFKEAPFGTRKFFYGFHNYVAILTDPEYLGSIWKTLLFTVLVIGLGLSISLLMAVMLNQRMKGIKFYRMFFFMPYAISPAVAASLWVFLLNPAAGFINYLFYLFFHIQPAWLTNGALAFVSITLANIWKNMGFNILFFLAGLQSIPESTIEAGKIDGAGPFQNFFKITIPLLSPTTFYLVTMNLIFSVFENFGIIDIMTQGGPAGATNLLMYNLYQDLFIYFRSGAAAAETVILFLLLMSATLIYFYQNQENIHYQ
jgi:sn-glycerol 3-phosphate transport system permease protein